MITLRGKRWWLRRRVPEAYAAIEPRKEVTLSLKTDSYEIAQQKAASVWGELIEGWEAQLSGDDAAAVLRHKQALRIASRLGVGGYKPASVLASHETAIAELLARIEAIQASGAAANDPLIDGALGLADRPPITLSNLIPEYENAVADRFAETPNQLKKHMNPRKRAVSELLDVLGRDVSLDKITGEDIRSFRDFLLDRVRSGEITSASARKGMNAFRGTFRKVNAFQQLGLAMPFEGIEISKGAEPDKISFSTGWIESKLLADGALDGLNAEARHILLMMVNTGARPSELAGLKVKHVLLGGEIPMIDIREDGRRLKTKNSTRRMPLAGVSLIAAQDALSGAVSAGRSPDDWLFPRYAEKPDSLSAVVNKYLRTNGLKETDSHTFYALRHSFRSRLDEVGVGTSERVTQDLMGHALQSPRYGDGGGDAVRHAAVEGIALG